MWVERINPERREKSPLKIIQILTNLNWGDAIGNEVLAMDEMLKQEGYDSHIMAVTIHEGLQSKAEGVDFSCVSSEDLVIFHKATGDVLTQTIANLPCRKVMVYHNITPAKFFFPYDRLMSLNLWLGRRQLRSFASRMDACWADSSYNAEELIRCGAPKEVTKVLPILFSESEATVTPDHATDELLSSIKATKLLCIGRIAPNKKLEDAIKLYVHYRENIDRDAILYLVGGWDGLEKYYAKLKGFCADLGLNENQVVFTGRVTEEEKEAYLRGADTLLCMSEHEGFCVPLLEAAKRNLPILAYASTAVPETLGDNGLLFSDKNYHEMMEGLKRLRQEESFRESVIQKQHENMSRFDPRKVRMQLIDLIQEMEQTKMGVQHP